MDTAADQQLLKLLRAAAKGVAVVQRTDALKQCCTLLQTPDGATAGQRQAQQLWPIALRLLGDKAAAIRQTAAVLAGRLGALVTRPALPGMKAQGRSSSLFFDWALPLLSTSGGLDWSSQYWVLVALQECMSAVDDGARARHAHAVLHSVQALLESERTSPHLLVPILGVLRQVSRHAPSICDRLPDLVDLLLGWTFDEHFPDAAKPLVAEVFAGFGSAWQDHTQVASSLTTSLAVDMERVVQAEQPAEISEARRLFALANSWTAILRAAGSHLPLQWAALCASFSGVLAKAHARFADSARFAPTMRSFAEELCYYAHVLLAAAAAHASASSQTQTMQQSHGRQAAAVEQQSAADRLNDTSLADGPSQSETWAEAHSQIVSLVMSIVGTPGVSYAAIVAALKLHLQCLQILQRAGAALPSCVAVQLLQENSLAHLRVHSDSGIARLAAQTHLVLLRDMGLAAQTAAIQAVLASLRPDAFASARLHLGGPSSLRSLLYVQSGLQLLQHAVQHGSQDQQQTALQGIQDALLVTSTAWALALKVLDSLTTQRRSLQMLRLLRRLSCGPKADSGAQTAAFSMLIQWALEKPPEQPRIVAGQASDSIQALVVEGAVEAVHHTAGSQEPEHRAAAAAAVLSLCRARALTQGHAQRLLVLAAGTWSADVDASVADVHISNMLMLASHIWPPEAFPSELLAAEDAQLTTLRSMAVSHQHKALKPAQLTQLWDHFTQASPMRLHKHGLGAGSRQQHWLVQLYESCQAPMDTLPSAKAPPWSSSTSLLLCWALQEAARQCCAARMATHLGNASASFAALEKALHALSAPSASKQSRRERAAQTNHQPQLQAQAAWLLLEFVASIDKHMRSACSGSLSRSMLPANVLAFFSSTQKAGKDWSARILRLQVQAASASGHHQATVYYASKRLRALAAHAAVALEVNGKHRPAEPPGPHRPSSAQLQDGGEPLPARKVLQRREHSSSSQLPQDNGGIHGSNQKAPSPAQQLLAEMQSVVRKAASSLVHIRAPEALAGLHHICSTAFGALEQALEREALAPAVTLEKHFSWLRALQLHADGHTEAAATLLKQHVQQLADGAEHSSGTAGMFSLLSSQLCQCYTAVQDWQALHAWMQELQGLAAQLGKAVGAHASDLLPQQSASYLAATSLARKDWQTAESALRYSSPGWRDAADLGNWAEEQVLLAESLQLGGPTHRQPEHGAALQAQIGKARSAVLQVLEAGRNAAMPLSDTLISHLARVSALERCSSPQAAPPAGMDGTQAGATAGLMSKLAAEVARSMQRAEQGLTSTASYVHSAGGYFTGAQLMSQQSSGGYAAVQACRAAFQASALSNSKAASKLLTQASEAVADEQSQLSASAGAVISLIKLFSSAATQAEKTTSADTILRTATMLLKGQSPVGTDNHQEVTSHALLGLAALAEPIQELSSSTEQHVAALQAELSDHDLSSLPHVAEVTVSNTGQRAASQAVCWQSAALLSPHSSAAWLAAGKWMQANLIDSSPSAWLSSSQHTADPVSAAEPAALQQLVTCLCKGLAFATDSACSMADRLSALLVLLRLLKANAAAVGSVLAERLQYVPPYVWHAVVPQLFALLHHQQEAVSKTAYAILQHVQAALPEATLYPAVAQARQEETASAEVQQLVASLRQQHPDMLSQLESFMTEMDRITVLPEELWHSALQSLQVDVARRAAVLHNEVLRLKTVSKAADRQRIMAERYTAIMAPAVLVFQRQLRASFSADAQTPHETSFRTRFQAALQDACHALQNPDLSEIANFEKAAEPLHTLAGALSEQCRASKLSLASVSPVLAKASGQGVPLPMAALTVAPADASACGPTPSHMHPVADQTPSIASFGPSVSVLNSKTRPKKLQLTASDGSQHSFLLKGREDLRMDERLMQFLHVANLLQSDAGPAAASPGLRARVFSVTALGPKTGLLQWVDGTAPMYEAYRSWQRHLTRYGSGAPAARPADAFYAALVPALEARGLSRGTPRRAWPRDVLQKVTTDMARSTPSSLLADQLWTGSGCFADWWGRQQRYAGSLAFMSVVGYVLGLGDRHLDNILLDLNTAEVVHIDFNLAFDRGLQLRVPEIVPFRLTNIVQGALGVTGTAGTFSGSCEKVLRELRGNVPLLTDLVAAFVTDPLVEWSFVKDDHAASKDLEVTVGLNLFTSRMGERQQSLSALLQALGPALQAAAQALQACQADCEGSLLLGPALQAAEHELATLPDTIAELQQSASEAGQRQADAEERQAKLQTQLQAMAPSLADAVQYCQGWASRHLYFVGRCSGPDVAVLHIPVPELMSSASRQALGLASPVGLSNAPSCIQVAGIDPAISAPGWQQLLQRCSAPDQALNQLLSQHDQALHACLGSMQEYAAALRLVLPEAYSSTSHHHMLAAAFTAALQLPDAQQAVEAVRREGPKQERPIAVLNLWQAIAHASELRMPLISTLEGRLETRDGQMTSAAQTALATLQSQLEQDAAHRDDWAAALASFLHAVDDALSQEAAAQDTLASLQRVVPGLYCLLSVVKASAALGDWGFVQSLRGPLQALGAAAAFLQSAQQALDMFEAALMPELASQARIAKAQSLLPEEALVGTLQEIWADAIQAPTHRVAAAVCGVLTKCAPAQPSLPAKAGIAKRVEASLRGLLLLLASLMHCEAACRKLTAGSHTIEANPFQQECFKQVLDICCHDHSLPEGTEAEHLQHLQERLTSAFLQCTAAHVASVLLPCLQTVLQQLLTRLQPQTDREAAPAPTSPHAAAAASSQHSLEDHPLPRSQGAESSPSQSPTPGSSQEVGAGHSSSAAKQLRQALIQRLVSTAGPQRSQDIGAQSAEAALACAQQVQQANARQQAAVEWVHEAELDEALRDTGGLLRRPLPVVQSEHGRPAMTKRRTALLSMLQQGISHLHASSGQLGTCHSQAGKLEQALIAAAAKAAPQQQSKLKAVLAARNRWLIALQQHTATIQQDGEGLLQFEYSRMGVSWSLANGKEEDLPQFGASCALLERLLSASADAAGEASEAQQTKMESEADLRTAETKLEQAVGEQARCSEGLQAIMQPLQQHAMQLHSSLGSLLPLLSTCDEIADVSSMLQDLHRAIQGHESVAGLVEHIRLCAQHQQHLSSSSTSLPAPLRQLHAALHAALPTSELAEGDAAQTAAALIAALDQVTSQATDLDSTAADTTKLHTGLQHVVASASAAAAAIEQEHGLPGPGGLQRMADPLSSSPQHIAIAHDTIAQPSRLARDSMLTSGSSTASQTQPSTPQAAESRTASPAPSLASLTASVAEARLSSPAGKTSLQLGAQPTGSPLHVANSKPGTPGSLGRGGRQRSLQLKASEARRAAFARSVVAHFEAKMRGSIRPGDEHERSVAEQVQGLIKEASSMDNLCRMYEGWTPWM